MSEIEKQESQKTVVAFITGLLIGGLLVWVFSSTPEKKEEPEIERQAIEEVVKKNDAQTAPADVEKVVEKTNVADASISVVDQKAGSQVNLGTLSLPVRSGWVVVRDLMDGTPGNVLGAARFSADEGLMPTSVNLIRETITGSSYQVVYFTNEGTTEFKLGEDKEIEGLSATFKTN